MQAMKRNLYDSLLEWKNDAERKPLILEGARQVGKTWLLKEFGRNEYDNLVYVNCSDNDLAYSFDMVTNTGSNIRTQTYILSDKDKDKASVLDAKINKILSGDNNVDVCTLLGILNRMMSEKK